MKFDRQKLKDDFSRAATTYDAESMLQRRVLETLAGNASEQFLPTQTILDAGCGTGALAEIFKAHSVKSDLIGCDLALGMCEKAKARGGFASVINATTEHLPFADRAFHGVISSLTLQWINDPLEALYEWHRVTNEGGFLHLTTFGTQTLKELKSVFSMIDDEVHVSPFHSSHQLGDMLGLAGYGEVEMKTEVYKYFMPSYLALGKHLRAIGATNKASIRPRGMMSHRKLRKIDEFYHLFYRQNEGLPVTWEVHYVHAVRR